MRNQKEPLRGAVERFLSDVEREAKKRGWAISTYAQRTLGVNLNESAWRDGSVQLSTIYRIMDLFYEAISVDAD